MPSHAPARRPPRAPLVASLAALLGAIFAQTPPNLILGGDALRMINLEAPQTALEGDTIRLGCSFSLAGGKPEPAANVPGGASGAELLYAIKWYKDQVEFFRYLAQDWPHKQALPLEGLQVDVDKSDNQTVVLRNVSLRTSGQFRCEVSTEAPTFVTKSIERKLLVYSLPNEGPQIEESPWTRPAVRRLLGEQLSLHCSLRNSKPSVNLDWVLNESLNLTSSRPLHVSGRPLFDVSHKRLVRLPVVVATSTASPVGTGQSQLTGGAKQVPVYLDYELDTSKERQTIARPRGTFGPPVNLSQAAVDQLLETSTSKLSFTVDTNLLQFLLSGGGIWSQQQPPAKQSSTSGTSGGVRWRKGSRSGSSQQLAASGSATPPTRIVLKIKCVARVLHLNLFDEVKLQLVNRTKVETIEEFEAQHQRQRPNQDSAAGTWRGCPFWFALLISISSITLLAIN